MIDTGVNNAWIAYAILDWCIIAIFETDIIPWIPYYTYLFSAIITISILSLGDIIKYYTFYL